MFANAQGQGNTATAREIFTCVDAQGRSLTADRPIAACADREQRVLSPSGTVLRVIGPTLSPREQAEREERERQAILEAQRAQEERRRARALVVRYPTLASHERERVDALAQIDVVTQAARNRVNELAQQRMKLNQELEFYGGDASRAPDSLRRQIEDIEQSTSVQKRFIADQEEEKRRVNQRFSEERALLMKLWPPSAMQDAPTSARGTTPASTSAKH
ncbi:DUF4124 domain-containing protein [Variovorax dokdonensis]|nr:DUF4124 domain-containing protein [Variovorax dokdonensis]